ncbi:MAG: hypothetical protein SPI34_03355 [Opitutales bacterium]|nr:hypothetical protein [Opitutales bacterium]
MKALLATLFALCSALAAFAEADSAMLFIHTARNNPSITKDGKNFSANAFEKAEGFAFECKDNQSVYFVLSNKSSVKIAGPAKLKITKFWQENPVVFDKSTPYESQKTLTEISIENGTVFFLNPQLRPSSEFIVKTPRGEYDLRAQSAIFSVGEYEDKISLLNQNARLLRNKSFERLLTGGETWSVKCVNGNIVAVSRPFILGIEKPFADLKTAFDTVIISSDNGKLTPKRILPKTLLNEKPKHTRYSK